MRNLLLIFLIANYQIVNSQVSNDKLNDLEKKHMQTITDIATCLKNRPTIFLSVHETSAYNNIESFYDTLIEKFFASRKMQKMFRSDTSVFSVEGKIDILRHVLNACDYYVDVVPSDSILVRPYRLTIEESISDSYKEKDIYDMLELYFVINKKEVPILSCLFDKESARIISLLPLANPGKEKDVLDFIKRQKAYYKFPSMY